jgi:hypothetical protein
MSAIAGHTVPVLPGADRASDCLAGALEAPPTHPSTLPKPLTPSRLSRQRRSLSLSPLDPSCQHTTPARISEGRIEVSDGFEGAGCSLLA